MALRRSGSCGRESPDLQIPVLALDLSGPLRHGSLRSAVAGGRRGPAPGSGYSPFAPVLGGGSPLAAQPRVRGDLRHDAGVEGAGFVVVLGPGTTSSGPAAPARTAPRRLVRGAFARDPVDAPPLPGDAVLGPVDR